MAGEEDPGAALDDVPAVVAPRVLLGDLAMVKSPRWHDGRLWFPQWGTPQIIAVDLAGQASVAASGPSGLGHSIGWLPDGRMLVTGHQLVRHEPDGSVLVHADLSRISKHSWSEMTVDGRGHVYVNSIGFDYSELPERAKDPSGSAIGLIALVTPDGASRQVAGEIAFPNGMVVTPDNRTLIVAESFTGRLLAFDVADDGALSGRRVWAHGIAPDGICLDADGAVWTATAHDECVRIAEGGAILERIQLDRACLATMLGGPDRRTLFIMTNRFVGVDRFGAMLAQRDGQVLVVGAPAPGAGWP